MRNPDHLENRKLIVQRLREEIVGPQPLGDPVDLSRPPRFARFFDAWKPAHQADSGEEILTRDRPTKRYGSGVLFPRGTEGEDGGDSTISGDDAGSDDNEDLSPDTDPAENGRSRRADNGIAEMRDRGARSTGDGPHDDLDLTGANQLRPNVMAVTFFCEVGARTSLQIRARGGRYERVKVKTGDGEMVWWARKPVLGRSGPGVGPVGGRRAVRGRDGSHPRERPTGSSGRGKKQTSGQQ